MLFWLLNGVILVAKLNLAEIKTQIYLWIATLAKLARNDGRHGKIRYFIVAPRFDFIKACNDKQNKFHIMICLR